MARHDESRGTRERVSVSPIHLFDPAAAPDSGFEPGAFHHLVPGNRGRLLDPRRTPVSIVGIDVRVGNFLVRIDGFEDRGAVWEVPFESVGIYQFANGSTRAADEAVAAFRAAAARFDVPLEIPCDPAAVAETAVALDRCTDEAHAWFQKHSRFVSSGEALDTTSLEGSAFLTSDLGRFMRERHLASVETSFAARFVSNPHSGEIVKGHRIVLAEMGLVPYAGKIVRDPKTLAGPWKREARRRHILARLAFVRALFRIAGRERVVLYRGLCCDGPPSPPRNDTFLSASFSFDVARSCTGERAEAGVGVLYRQAVPVERVFMTYLETAALNHPFREAEAILLWSPGDVVF